MLVTFVLSVAIYLTRRKQREEEFWPIVQRDTIKILARKIWQQARSHGSKEGLVAGISHSFWLAT